MPPQPLDQHGHLGGLAYRLGHAAIALHLDARRHWELAEPGNPADEFFGPEEPSSPFPRELSRHSEVITEASRGLVAALPALDRELLHESLLRAWHALKEAWLGPSHRRMIVEREEGDGGGVDPAAASPFRGREWSDFHQAVHQFCESLPEGLGDCAALGTHVAAVRGIVPPGDRQESLPETVSPSPFAVLGELLPRVVKSYPALGGLELDVSEDHYLATNDKPRHGYWSWRQDQVERLHEQILERLAESERATRVVPEEWISAKDAELRAREDGVDLPLHRIKRLIAKDPAPFRSRIPRKQRLELELGGLLIYLDKEKRKPREAPDSEQSRPAQLAKSDIQKKAEKQTRKEQEERAMKEQRAEEARKKPGQAKPNR